jgi:hypothetical protein
MKFIVSVSATPNYYSPATALYQCQKCMKISTATACSGNLVVPECDCSKPRCSKCGQVNVREG